MNIIFALILALTCVASHAQVFKCKTANGQTVYSDTQCEYRAKSVNADKLSTNTVDAERSHSKEEDPKLIPLQASLGVPKKCPTAIEIKNMETSASSRSLKASEREFKYEEISRARDCQMGITREPSERKIEKPSKLVTQALSPTSLVNCDNAGCWDTNGQRYNNAAGGNFFRSDGAFCHRTGSMIQCN